MTSPLTPLTVYVEKLISLLPIKFSCQSEFLIKINILIVCPCLFPCWEREANNLSFRAKFPPLPHPKAEEQGEGNCIWKGTLAGTQSFGDVLHFMARCISVAVSFSRAVGDLSSLLYWKKLQAYISWGNTITNRPGTVGDCSLFLSSEAALFCKRELSSQG